MPEGTELTLTQTKVPAEQTDDYDQGWYDSYWKPMMKYFERGGKRRRS